MEEPHLATKEGASLVITFEKQVPWDGWAFVTSNTSSADYDPVRFTLHSSMVLNAGGWALIGSSTYIDIAGSTTLFHGYFETSTLRGQINTFNLPRQQAGLQFTLVWFRAWIHTLTPLSSVVELTHFACKLEALCQFGQMIIPLITSRMYLHDLQPTGAFIFFVFSLS